MKVLAVLGPKDSGKTTVVEFIINHLSKEGYKVGAVKHVHHDFTIDSVGKDTWKFSKAGSQFTVSISPNEIVIMKKPRNQMSDLDDILEMGRRSGLDILILEGFHELIGKHSDIPKIVTAKDANELELISEDLTSPILAISGVIAGRPEGLGVSLPVLDVHHNGHSLIELIKNALFNREKPVEAR